MAARKKNVDIEMPDNMQLQRGEKAQMALRLVGVEDLIVHQWGQKAVIQLLSKAAGHDLVRLPKDLTREYEESAYKNEKGQHVMPCRIIKKVGVAGAISSGKAITKAELNRGLRVLGHTAVIQNATPRMHTMIARTTSGTPDVRARTVYDAGWFVEFVVQFYPKMISPQKVVHSFRLAGEDIGFCEMRIEKGFPYGAFEVESVEENRVNAILKACASPERMFEIPPELLRAAGASPDAAKSDTVKKVLSNVRNVNGAAKRHVAASMGDAE